MKLIEDETKRYKVFFNVVVLILSLYGISQDQTSVKRVSFFENVMINSLAPIQSSVVYLKREVTSVFDHYVFNISASKENIKLKKNVAELQNEIFHYQELAKENKRLKDLLQFGEAEQFDKVLAQIVAWDASSDFRVIRINKGAKDGVKLQSMVVTAQGLVGYVYRLTDHFADILTILDSDNRVDGIVARTRSHGIIEGYNSSKCLMKYVTRVEPVVLNDLVLTSGLGNIYSKGIKIGTISKIERESYGMTQYIEVAPSVDFSRLEEVIVLVMKGNKVKQSEWTALDNSVGGKK